MFVIPTIIVEHMSLLYTTPSREAKTHCVCICLYMSIETVNMYLRFAVPFVN